MSNIQTGAERMPHDLSHLGFLAGQIGRLITISTTPVIAGDSFEMDAVGALRLSPLRRGLAIDSTVDIFTFYVPHRHRSEERRVGEESRYRWMWYDSTKRTAYSSSLINNEQRRDQQHECRLS